MPPIKLENRVLIAYNRGKSTKYIKHVGYNCFLYSKPKNLSTKLNSRLNNDRG